jgi:hypothetical protein
MSRTDARLWRWRHRQIALCDRQCGRRPERHGVAHRLTPARAVPAAYLDWETIRDTLEARLAQLAAGFGIAPPTILYKRMARPLVNAVAALAAEFARRGPSAARSPSTDRG